MLEQFEKMMEYCAPCPRLCQSACPVAMEDGRETHTPWGIMQTLNLLRKGEIPFDEEVARLSYQCLTCKACTTQCAHGNVIPPVVEEVRKEAIRRELAPPEISNYIARFHRHNNPFSKDLLEKLRGLLDPKHLEKDTSTTYFSSCTTISKTPEVIKDTFDLFEKLKINFVSAYPETIQCCGYPLLAAGQEEDFIDLAEINYHALKKYKTIISGSPTCVYTLKKTYDKYSLGLPGRVMTINKFLEPYFQNINYKIKKNFRTKLMYHDPCYLSRYLHEVDLPRELIAQVSGYEPVEFFNNQQRSGCSGQGGCYSVMERDNSQGIAKRRMEEVYERDISLVVTQCPSCIDKFRKNSRRVVVKDLVSYLNDCIEGTKE